MIQPMRRGMHVRKSEIESVNGIVIPERFRQSHQACEVLAVGPKCREIKAGYTVWLPGIALTVPDHVLPDGTILVDEEDVGVYRK